MKMLNGVLNSILNRFYPYSCSYPAIYSINRLSGRDSSVIQTFRGTYHVKLVGPNQSWKGNVSCGSSHQSSLPNRRDKGSNYKKQHNYYPIDGKRRLCSAQGRQGKGLIYAFAAGNDKSLGDNCGGDSFVSSIYTIAAAISNFRGQMTSYSERCPGC